MLPAIQATGAGAQAWGAVKERCSTDDGELHVEMLEFTDETSE
jgi:hypothetical protein